MKTTPFISLLLIVFTLFCFDGQAINKVKIATIGGGYDAVNAGIDRKNPQVLVDRMIEYWKQELKKVWMYQPDLILLTEVCDAPIGLTDQERTDYYKVRKNQVQDFFASAAKENRCYIAFGTRREENGLWRNACVVLDRQGRLAGVYHKNYPTVYEMPEITPSSETPVIQCDFGRVVCAVCFDLNFDELRDRNAALKPDIILFPSLYHGGLEQGKWAYTCRSFFVSSYGFLTSPSQIRNPFGEVVASSTNYHNYAIATVNLDRQLVHQDFNREKLQALKRKYGEKVIISDHGELGVMMVASEHETVSAADMVKEFDVELLDSYFDRSRRDRLQNLK